MIEDRNQVPGFRARPVSDLVDDRPEVPVRSPSAVSPVAINVVLAVQGVSYVLVAGLWPLLGSSSFLALTGPTPDPFRLLTTDLLVVVVGLSLAVAAIPPRRKGYPPVAIYVLAIGTPCVFMLLEILYRDSLSWAYGVDFGAQAVILALLLWFGRNDPRWSGAAIDGHHVAGKERGP